MPCNICAYFLLVTRVSGNTPAAAAYSHHQPLKGFGFCPPPLQVLRELCASGRNEAEGNPQGRGAAPGPGRPRPLQPRHQEWRPVPGGRWRVPPSRGLHLQVSAPWSQWGQALRASTRLAPPRAPTSAHQQLLPSRCTGVCVEQTPSSGPVWSRCSPVAVKLSVREARQPAGKGGCWGQ